MFSAWLEIIVGAVILAQRLRFLVGFFSVPSPMA